MAKAMAVIENDKVTNIVWCSDEVQETDELKDVFEKLVRIGDTYNNGEYYRNGDRVLSQLEELSLAADEMYSALKILGVVDDKIRTA